MEERAKVFWLREGDCNTKFFHAATTARKKKNLISRLMNANGEWIEDRDALGSLLTDYFSGMFSSSPGITDSVVDVMPACITDEMNNELLAPYSDDEIKSTVFSMQPDKAPGLDGFNPAFYQSHWDIVGPAICAACIYFLEQRCFPANLNNTLLVLIPKKARGAPMIHHLFFADDSLLVFRADVMEASMVKQVIATYAQASGQHINLRKSSACFSKNVSADLRGELCSVLGVEETPNLGIYLGLPTRVGINKKEVFAFLKDRVWKKLNSWKRRCLSKAGKEVMLKTVLQALPNYVMNLFVLPKTFCHELQRMLSNFWWGKGKNHDKGLCWVSWDRMSRPKCFGGLGFKKLHETKVLWGNAWKLLSAPNSFVARLLKAKYFPNTNFLNAQLGCNPSFVWRSLHDCQELIRKGACKRIGRGSSTSIWNDPWLYMTESLRVTTPMPVDTDLSIVADLTSNGSWRSDVLLHQFCEADREAILSIPISSRFHEDSWFWKFEKKGLYTIKSSYKILTPVSPSFAASDFSSMWRKLWNLQIPPKCRNFLWRLCLNALPTVPALQHLRRRACLMYQHFQHQKEFQFLLPD
ncbi:uncharacterized protein LOC119369495 [Jatropha curcas]|uniref:uncharacterized protein LOC119369495 n=1 Tax=Jatropha curcas TaxID=180498 RepID=UPI0018941053|nr:uncharacterized protein LOC119369495 [Jatropha curcas]